MTDSIAEPISPPDGGSLLRVKPSVAIGIAIYAGYLAIFYTTWAINGVDYPHIGETVESAKLHYAMPTLLGSAFLVVAITALGWWRPVLFDRARSGPAWAWVGPIFMFVVGVSSFAIMKTDNVSGALVMWSILGGLGVGFGEEVITRGTMLVGFRSRLTEGKVWLYSTLFFSALHIPNVLFGLEIVQMPGQLVLTFVFGSLLYATRRLSGTLLLPMLLHGLWDSSVFLPHAAGSDPNPVTTLLYPVAAVCAFVVIRRNWNERILP